MRRVEEGRSLEPPVIDSFPWRFIKKIQESFAAEQARVRRCGNRGEKRKTLPVWVTPARIDHSILVFEGSWYWNWVS